MCEVSECPDRWEVERLRERERGEGGGEEAMLSC